MRFRPPTVVLALLDLEHADITHVVLYETTDGCLTSIIDSRDRAPFETDYELLQWLIRTVQAHGVLSAS
jgi:hypothetical protein